MYILFDKYGLVKPNDCDVNYIDIYENVLSDEKRMARFCGTATEPQKSDGSVINIRFHAKESVVGLDNRNSFEFEILYTAFRENNKDKCIPSTEFDCDDGTCIDISLKCNKAYNCKYRYDEDLATTCLQGATGVKILTSEHMIIILIVFFALVVGMCASIIVSCWGKIQERRQRELEYKMRRSREASVEQGLDRTVTVTSLDRNIMGHPDFPPPLPSSVLGQRSAKLSETNLMRGNSNEDDDEDEEEDDAGCYVPDMDDYRKSDGHLIDDKYSPNVTPSRMGGRVSGGGLLPGGPLLHQQHSLTSEPTMSSDCPLYMHHQHQHNQQHQHQQHQHQQQQQHHQHQHRDRRDESESPIPPPPPPPAMSHLKIF
ncbi:hypothetical protein HDE_00062 [Halotydeus destructor]|nr:hypothetical protein HDE_00062 [Halotydeus destructor]